MVIEAAGELIKRFRAWLHGPAPIWVLFGVVALRVLVAVIIWPYVVIWQWARRRPAGRGLPG